MKLFAVAIRDYKVAYIEFYWADDLDHAEEQAINAHPTSRIVCARAIPYNVERGDECPQ